MHERERFEAKIERTPYCWLWTGSRLPKGYGQFGRKHGESPVLAHRLAWEYEYGPIPPGMVVRHEVCDNPPCVNPAHLLLGTTADNNADMLRKGRQVSGLRKLSADEVRAVRVRYSAGETQAALGLAFGLTQTNIGRLVRGESYRWVDP